MISKEEEKALDISHNIIHRWYQPTGTMIGILLIVSAIIYQFFSLHEEQRNLNKLVESNRQSSITAKQVAVVAAEAAYRNCMVTKALEDWSDALGKITPPVPEARSIAFKQLRTRLGKINGIICLPSRAVTNNTLKAIQKISGPDRPTPPLPTK